MERHSNYDASTNLYAQKLAFNHVFKAAKSSGYPVTLHAYLDSERAVEERIRFHKHLQEWEYELQTNQLKEANQTAYQRYFKVSKDAEKGVSIEIKKRL